MPSGSRPTRLGFCSTVFPWTRKTNSLRGLKNKAERTASYRLTRRIATREGGRENGGASTDAILGIFQPVTPGIVNFSHFCLLLIASAVQAIAGTFTTEMSLSRKRSTSELPNFGLGRP